jgi:hypothetical protein
MKKTDSRKEIDEFGKIIDDIFDILKQIPEVNQVCLMRPQESGLLIKETIKATVEVLKNRKF